MVAVTIELPSPAQLSKLMKGRPVRIKHLPAGSPRKGMEIDLAEGSLKKLMRSFSKGSGMIHSMPVHTMPYPVRGHPLMGKGAAFPHLVKHTTGEGVDTQAAHGRGFFESLSKGEPYVLSNGVAPMSLQAISEGRPFGEYLPGVHGKGVKSGKISRSKKFHIWTKNLGGVYQSVADAVKPVAKPILEALTKAAVSKITPQASYEKKALDKLDPAKGLVTFFRGLFGKGLASSAEKLARAQFEKMLIRSLAGRSAGRSSLVGKATAPPRAGRAREDARVAFEALEPETYAVPERMENHYVEEGGVPLDYKYFGAGAKRSRKSHADKALESRITDSLGGRPAKGSPEMKARMAALRARKKGGAGVRPSPLHAGAMYPAGY